MLRSSLNLWIATLLDNGSAASTARNRQLAGRRFSTWLADPGRRVKSPKLDERVIEPLSDAELKALLKACQPPKGAEPKVALRFRRDEALIRLMFETGMRAGEAVALEIGDLHLAEGVATVRRGHRLATSSEALWLASPTRGRPCVPLEGTDDADLVAHWLTAGCGSSPSPPRQPARADTTSA